jgi:hypothetical protein
MRPQASHANPIGLVLQPDLDVPILLQVHAESILGFHRGLHSHGPLGSTKERWEII